METLYAREREWRRIRAAISGEGDAWKAPWFRIESAAKSKTASIYVYGEIGWEVTSGAFAQALDSLDGVTQIDLHINSPGGSVFEGLAIYNMLRRHSANVSGTVDGLAASAASFIAMACDELAMGTGTQMMIHDASGGCFGRASDMHEMGDILDRTSDEVAGFYARRAGGTVTTWRDAMRAETWYTGEEAVAAGLADRVTEPAEEDEPDDELDAAAEFDLSVFAYAGRAAAPAPPAPPAPVVDESDCSLTAFDELVSAIGADPQSVDSPVDDISAMFAHMTPTLPWAHLVPSDTSSPDRD